MEGKIRLPKLNQLRPTMESTLLKLMEEAGELARAVLSFLPFQGQGRIAMGDNGKARETLGQVAEELLDVAQTCVSMIFVMEELYRFRITDLLDAHLAKLQSKGYRYDPNNHYFITSERHFKYMCLPRLEIAGVTLLKTVCKIQEEIGELAQYLGKKSGRNGEQSRLSEEEIVEGCALELLDIAQCCFTMMYILEEKYAVDMGDLVDKHVQKLQHKGYCTLEVRGKKLEVRG